MIALSLGGLLGSSTLQRQASAIFIRRLDLYIARSSPNRVVVRVADECNEGIGIGRKQA